MEHSSLITTFSLSSLREHFHQPFVVQKTVIASEAVPTVLTGEYDLTYALPVNHTGSTSRIISIPYLKLIGAIIIPSPTIPRLTQIQLMLFFLTTWILSFYLFYYRKSIKASKRPAPSYVWPEYPFPLIHYTTTKATHSRSHYSHHAARLMASTHNTIFRGLNAVYAQSFYVRPGTKPAADLFTYCAVVVGFLHHHHEIEERIFFPAISAAIGDPGFTEANVAQHRAFEFGLEALRLYTTTMPPTCFSAHTLRRMIEAFASVLTQHLHDEIPSILSLHNKIPSATLREIYSRMVVAAEKESDPFIAAPFVMGCQDTDFLLDGLCFQYPEHPLPLPLIKFLTKWVISWRYRGLWKFNPSTLYGEPRKTAFCGRG